MKNIRLILVTGLLLMLAACSKFKTYNGPEVTHILVDKSERVMVLLHNDQVLERFNFRLGFTPEGHKQVEGDGKTPEGTYFIDRKNPNSSFHLSLGISYPNAQDRATARAMGKSPGGDIFIHGTPRKFRRTAQDWTWGCIAVTNREAEKIYAMVNVGTPITILP